MRRSRWLWVGLLWLALGSAEAAAETYLWTDERGRVHMTDDLSQVPPAQRSEAVRAGIAASQIDLVRPEGAIAPRPTPELREPRPAAPSPAEAPRRHVLEVERVGSELRVVADVDGVPVPFILDTGASTCALPAWALAEMDVTIDEDTARVPVVGISGKAMLVPEIRVERVSVGEAVVESLHMTVLETMREGLLGMPFFNHFRVSTDPIVGTLILEEIDLESVPGVVAGLSEETWRRKFAQRRGALAAIRAQLDDVPYEYVTIRERLEKQVDYWERQLELLDLEASQAGVPYEWRE